MQDQLALMKVRSNCEIANGDLIPQPSFKMEIGHIKTAQIEKFSITFYLVNYLLESLIFLTVRHV